MATIATSATVATVTTVATTTGHTLFFSDFKDYAKTVEPPQTIWRQNIGEAHISTIIGNRTLNNYRKNYWRVLLGLEIKLRTYVIDNKKQQVLHEAVKSRTVKGNHTCDVCRTPPFAVEVMGGQLVTIIIWCRYRSILHSLIFLPDMSSQLYVLQENNHPPIAGDIEVSAVRYDEGNSPPPVFHRDVLHIKDAVSPKIAASMMKHVTTSAKGMSSKIPSGNGTIDEYVKRSERRICNNDNKNRNEDPFKLGNGADLSGTDT